MKTKKILVLKPIKNKVSHKRKKIIFINHLAFFRSKKYITKIKPIVPKSNYSEFLINKQFKAIEFNYEKILNELAILLNKYHKTNFSIRFWGILIGPWLYSFLSIFSYNFYNIREIIKNYKPDEIEMFNYKNFNFCPNETGGIFFATEDANWFSMFNSLLIDNLIKSNIKKKFVKVKSNFKDKFSFYGLMRSRKRNKLYLILKIYHFFSKLFCKKNDAFIIGTSLPEKINIKLNFAFKQLPQFWESKYHVKSKFSIRERKKLKLIINNSENLFSKTFREILNKFIPIIFVEDFKNLNYKVDKSFFPKNPRFIFTSTSFQFDDFVKLYISKCTEKGIKYFVGQHGNNYFSEKQFDFSLLPELKLCDYFLSWGKNNLSRKFLPAFNFRTADRSWKASENGKIVFFLKGVNERQVTIWDKHYEGILGCQAFLQTIKYISPKYKNRFVVRLPNTHNSKEKEFINKYFNNSIYLKNIQIDDFRIWKRELFNLASGHVHMYDSTGFLECLSLNFPTLCFLPLGTKTICDKAKDDYNRLIKTGIIFTNPKKLSKHLNFLLKNNIADWWYSKKVQEQIKNFRKKYCLQSNEKSHLKLKNIIINNL